jgi:aspartyl-tRNA(Asn)/glutamyl-tRNA(Gln) amidotransferase subunit A
LCGITGLKTTYGLVSRFGVVPLAWSLDTCGPMARTVEDCALMLQAIAGYDTRDDASANQPIPGYRQAIHRGASGLRIGVPWSWIDGTDGLDAEVRGAFVAALDVLNGQGMEVVEVDGTPFAEARVPQMLIMMAEAYAYHEERLKTRPRDLGSGPRTRLREASLLTAADYIQAQRVRLSAGRCTPSCRPSTPW